VGQIIEKWLTGEDKSPAAGGEEMVAATMEEGKGIRV
jgi:hypothetical protein